MLPEGVKAPDFTLPDENGEKVKLSDFAGKTVVLYFYPKDETPGCTVEACGFRDLRPEFEKRGASIVGVSPDSPESHSKFAEHHHLPFTLLSDEGGKVAQQYGVWADKGNGSSGNLRTTFVIAPDGEVEKVFQGVKPEGHNNEVLEWLDKSNG